MGTWKGVFKLTYFPMGALLFGYFWIFISWLIQFEVPSSGAILLCMCVIAELFLGSQEWVRISFRDYSYVAYGEYIEEPDSPMFSFYNRLASTKVDPSTKKPTADVILSTNHPIHRSLCVMFDTSGKKYATKLGALPVKNYDQMQRSFHLRAQMVVAFSAILGSVLWGYGHLFF